MQPIFLFEAGGTKTTLLVQSWKEEERNSPTYRIGHMEEIHLPGFNPNRFSPEFEQELKAKVKIPKGTSVFFYGSGLLEEANKQIVRDIFKKQFDCDVFVYDDVLGAARATLQGHAGLVAIMGTGGGVAHYDGEKIVRRHGGYGYLIDDYGGGLELGKLVLSAWLNGVLPKNVDAVIAEFVRIPKEQFIREFYLTKDLKILAEIVRVIHPYQSTPKLKTLLSGYFKEFFRRHVVPLKQRHETTRIAIVGSVGTHFSSVVNKEAHRVGLKEVFFNEKPASALLMYHVLQERFRPEL